MRLRVPGLLFVPLAMVVAWSSPAAAQMRGYPPYYPAPYPYGSRYAGPEGDLRIDVKPRNAMVYVDGYYAGLVDEFDGVFQRLHVAPGNHEIVVYLQGYRSLHEKLYVGPNSSRKISAKLEPLPAGEPNEPVPVPAEPPSVESRPAPRGGPGRYAPPLPPRGGPDGARRPAPPDDQPQASVGTVVIRVQPEGSQILIDGERWEAPARSDERLVVQLSSGHHVIEIRKDGYREMRTEIDVRGGDTTPLNVSLTPER